MTIKKSIKPHFYSKISKETNKNSLYIFFKIEDLDTIVNLENININKIYYLNLNIDKLIFLNKSSIILQNNQYNIIFENLSEEIINLINNSISFIFYFFTENQKFLYKTESKFNKIIF